MPDHDRKPAFIHTLSQNSGDGAPRCPSCRGTGVTLQDDCVCCGREVVVCQVPKAEEITNSVKALRIKTEAPDGPQSIIIPSFEREREPVIPIPAAGPRPWSERQRRSNIPSLRPRVGTRYASLGLLQQQNLGDNHRNAARTYQQQAQYAVSQFSLSSSSSSSRRGPARGSSRGGALRGTEGAHPTLKGVRTRKGVKGFLVEIRPPKWKKTIWLGTYNTSAEAAAAHDAGVFYTKKFNAKFHFDTSEGAFPPLPAHLQLDRPEHMESIKLFVQSQARAAARRMANFVVRQAARITHVENNPVAQPTSSGSCLTGSDSANSVSVNTDLQTADTEVIDEIDSEFGQLPLDYEYFDHCWREETVAEETEKDMFLDYTNYVSQQGGPGEQEFLPADV